LRLQLEQFYDTFSLVGTVAAVTTAKLQNQVNKFNRNIKKKNISVL